MSIFHSCWQGANADIGDDCYLEEVWLLHSNISTTVTDDYDDEEDDDEYVQEEIYCDHVITWMMITSERSYKHRLVPTRKNEKNMFISN